MKPVTVREDKPLRKTLRAKNGCKVVVYLSSHPREYSIEQRTKCEITVQMEEVEAETEEEEEEEEEDVEEIKMVRIIHFQMVVKMEVLSPIFGHLLI